MISGRLSMISIASKLRALLMLGGMFFILLFGAIYIYYGTHVLRETLINDSARLASLLGSRNVASLSFQNPAFAKTTLEDAITDSSYRQICLYSANGDVFAAAGMGECPILARARSGLFQENETIENGVIFVARNIVAQNEIVGAIAIRRGQEAIHAYVTGQIQTMIIIALLSCVGGYFIANYLQRFISRPILDMAKTAQLVSMGTGSDARFLLNRNDELGKVADAFNRILTNMESKIMQYEEDNLNLKKSSQLFIQQLERLMGHYSESLESFNTYTEMLTQHCMGDMVDSYAPYQNDVATSFAIYATNFESFIRVSQVYAEAIAGPRSYIDLAKQLASFVKSLKLNAPFMMVEMRDSHRNVERARLLVYRPAWDEIFKLLFNLYSILSSLVEFTPALKIMVEPLPLRVTMVLFDRAQPSPSSASEDQFSYLKSGYGESEAHSLEMHDFVQPFINEELFTHEDMQFFLDTLAYIAHANSVHLKHDFKKGEFVIMLDLSQMISESSVVPTAQMVLQ